MSKAIGGMGAIAVLLFSLFSVGWAGGNGATVIGQFGCMLLGADAGLVGVDFLVTAQDNQLAAVITPSGDTMLTCHFDIPAGFEPAKAIKNRGFPCLTFLDSTSLGLTLGLTLDSNSVATPGGKAHLTCFVKHPKP